MEYSDPFDYMLNVTVYSTIGVTIVGFSLTHINLYTYIQKLGLERACPNNLSSIRYSLQYSKGPSAVHFH